MQVLSSILFYISVRTFTEMKIKVGDIVNSEVLKSGKTKTQIAKDIGLSRVHFSNLLAEPDMELEYVLAIGKSIRHDFKKDLPDMSHLIVEDDIRYETLNTNQLKTELLDMQRKYLQLQDDYIKTLKDLLDCRSQNGLAVQ